jgi:hypothetical protein
MENLHLPNMKSTETYSAIALSALLGVATPALAIPAVTKQEIYHIEDFSSQTYFEEAAVFTSSGNAVGFLPDLPIKHKVKARIVSVRSIEFSREMFD